MDLETEGINEANRVISLLVSVQSNLHILLSHPILTVALYSLCIDDKIEAQRKRVHCEGHMVTIISVEPVPKDYAQHFQFG